MATLLVSAGLYATTAAATTALINTAVSVGLSLASRALLPDQTIKQEGPRLSQSQITGATEGSPIIRTAGSVRIGGQLIWSTTFNEQVVTSTESRGGKGGPKAVTQTTEYVYSASFAVGLCEADGDVTLGRVWFDGKEDSLENVQMRFYDGSQTQPDSKIEAVEGAGSVPAFKGTAYIVFEALDLTNFGNRLPQVTCEVVRSVNKLSEIITETCTRVNVTDVDVSQIAERDLVLDGLLIGAITSPRSVLDNMMSTFLFDAVEDQGVLRFFYRNDNAVVPFDLDDAVLRESGDSYSLARVQDEDLPDRTQVDFIDPLRDYNAASVDGHTVTGNSRRVASLSTLAIIKESYARAIADILTHEMWVGRDSVSISMPFGSPVTGNEYFSLKPGAIFTLDGVQFRVLSRLIGDQIDIEAAAFAGDIYDLVQHGNTFEFEDTLIEIGASTIVFADLPLLSSESPAPYSPRVVAYQKPWPIGVAVYEDDGSGGELLNSVVLVSGIIGATESVLGRGEPFFWDTSNSVTIRFSDTRYNPASLSDESVLNGANTLALLTPSGEWEVFQFATAVLNEDGSYTLSRLLRGQLGTEPYIANNAPVGSTVVVYDSGRWGTLEGTTGIIGAELDLRYGPADQIVSDERFQDITVTPQGVPYRPYAPAHPRQIKDGGGNIELSWVRRSRFDGDAWGEGVVPLNEDFERYLVTIYDGTTEVRLFEVSDATSVTYSVANQTADFGSSQTSVSWTVQQISAIYGAGSIANG